MRPASIVVLVAATLAARAVDAQSREQQPVSIPTELAVALVGNDFGPSGGVPLFAVGRAPARFPASLVPPAPATVVGGMWDGVRGALIVSYPAGERDAMSRVLESLRAAGWTPAPMPDLQSGGFVTIGEGGPLEMLCRGDESASVTRTHTRPGVSSVQISVFGTSEGSMCAAERREERERFGRRFKFPTLRPPVGVRSTGGSGGGGTDYYEITTRLVGDVRADSLASHYAAQLAAAGWHTSGPVRSDGLVVRPVSTRDEKGDEWRGTLVALELGPNSRHVSIRVARVRP